MDRQAQYSKPVTRSAAREQPLKHPIPVAESIDSAGDCTLKSFDHGNASQSQKPGKAFMTAPATEESLSIGWVVQGEVSSYNISYSQVNEETGKTGKWLHQTTEDTTTNTFSLAGLTPDTPYKIRVNAVNEDEDGMMVFQGVTSDILRTAKVTPLATPTSIRLVEAKYDTMKITWDLVDNANSICCYTVSLQRVGCKVWKVFETDCPDKPVILTGLKPNTNYRIRVVAHSNSSSSLPGFTKEPIATSALLPPTGTPCLVTSGNSKPTHDSLTITWDMPDSSKAAQAIDTPTYYTLQYKDVTQDTSWMEQQTKGTNNQGTIFGLEPEKSYTVRVIWHSQTFYSQPSQIGGPFKTTTCKEKEQIFKQNIVEKSKHVHSDKEMPLYQLPLKMTEAHGRIEKKEFGLQDMARVPEEKVILTVGATGAGKSTFINAMVNFVLGTDWTDNFRFRLVEESGLFDAQHKSQTRLVTVYKLHHQVEFKVPYTLTIIDTPGFGDTDGIERDKEITESINDLFKSTEFGVDHIDAIGFVAQSSLSRLTANQRYIFDSILSLFGKDIESNIFLLITFCDPQKPPVLASIKEAMVPYNLSFKFNNSALFASNVQTTEDNEFNQIYWDMGVKAFQNFVNVLGQVEEKSLQLTKAVLEERKQLETYVAGLHEDIRIGLSKLEQLQKEVNVVRSHEEQITKNKQFTYQVKVQKIVKTPLLPGTNVTNCLTCNRTCHYPCKVRQDINKARCSAMDKEGNCKVCRQHCFWDIHRNVPYKIEYQEKLEERTLENLKTRYVKACGKKTNAQKLLNGIVEDFHESQAKVICLTNEVRRGIDRLNEIALRKNPLSVLNYIEILIQSEVSQSKPGWKDRVEQLQEMKAQAAIIAGISEDEGYDPFAAYQSILEKANPTITGKWKKITDELKRVTKKTLANTRKFLNIK